MEYKLVQEILKKARSYSPQLDYDHDIFNIMEGNLLQYLKEALECQLSDRAAKEAIDRCAPINILKKINDKLSKLYIDDVKRIAVDPANQYLVDYYSNEVNEFFQEANLSFNSYKRCNIEIYYDDNEREVEFRVIPPHLYVPLALDPINPLRMTHLVKIFDDKYMIYNDEEIVTVDKNGSVKGSIPNEYGKIPLAYISRSKYTLMPTEDTDSKQMAVLLPVLLSDLNFSIKYQTNPIVYGVDVDTENLERNPNVFWSFKSNIEGKTPSIGSISPNSDINGILSNIKEQMAFWLETKNIKANAIGISSGDQASSGLALMLRNIDTTEDRKQQVIYFRKFENEFWEVLSYVHNYLASIGAIDEKQMFTEETDVIVRYSDFKPIEERKDRVERLKSEVNAGFLTKEMAIRELNPDFSDEQVMEIINQSDMMATVDVTPAQDDQTDSEDMMMSPGDENKTMSEIMDS